MKKNKISKNWVNKQRRDTYVRQSKVDGYRARSAYKLKEIDEKFGIFKGGMSVIDIGAAPGSWSQYVSKIIKSGKIISIDLKEMENIEDTLQIKGLDNAISEGDLIFGANTGGQFTTLAIGTYDSTNSVGQVLQVGANGTVTWSNTLDGGTF